MNTFILANTDAVRTSGEIISEGIVGMAIVMVILFILTGVLAAVSLLFKEKPKTAPAAIAPVAVPAAATAVAGATGGISDAHLKVVLAAAVHTVLASERKSLQLAPGDAAWAGEGRRAIFQSKKLK